MNEDERVRALAAIFAEHGDARVALGIGDDAALVVPPAGESIVVTVDVQVEHVHFERAWLSFEDIGWRSFMAAASDLAAMGARPLAAVSALVLPRDVDDDALAQIARGQADAARNIGAPVVGGNLSRGGELSLTTTLLGSATRATTRSGAREGDGVWIAGDVGLSGLGLAALQNNVHNASMLSAISAWKRPNARIQDGRAMVGIAHAAIDVSDGVARDLARLLDASGVGAVIDEDALLAFAGPSLRAAANALERDPVDAILFGGEDYALIAASDAHVPGFTRVGEIARAPGLYMRNRAGDRPIAPRGFDHFER